MLLDDNLAVKQHILDARIKVRKEQRLLHMEMLKSILRLGIDLTCTRRNDILPEGLLEMGIADGRADGIRIRIAMADDINGFRILHAEKILPRINNA